MSIYMLSMSQKLQKQLKMLLLFEFHWGTIAGLINGRTEAWVLREQSTQPQNQVL